MLTWRLAGSWLTRRPLSSQTHFSFLPQAPASLRARPAAMPAHPPAAGVPQSEMDLLREQTAAARLAGGGGAAAAEAPAGPATAAATSGSGGAEEIAMGEVEALPGPSEGVSAESTEDLSEEGGGGGLLQVRGRLGRGLGHALLLGSWSEGVRGWSWS